MMMMMMTMMMMMMVKLRMRSYACTKLDARKRKIKTVYNDTKGRPEDSINSINHRNKINQRDENKQTKRWLYKANRKDENNNVSRPEEA